MDEAITFVERHDPALLSGTYEISVTQTLTSTVKPSKDENPILETYQDTRRFAVAGPRFSLAPTDIVAQFPPPNSQGEYASALPHVAVSRHTLPWARTAGGTLPWLAILVIDAVEGVAAVDAQVGHLQREPFTPDPKLPATPLPRTTASYADANPKWKLEHGQALSDRCRIIDIPVSLFGEIAPSADDLPWLAHARLTASDEIALVVANRTPPASGSATAHLVSLEGLREWLPPEAAPGADTVRLVSLASWSFSAIAPEETFAGRLKAASCGVLALPPPADGTSSAAETAQRATAAGYCGLRHRTRAGAEAVSWYRGPLVPCPPPSGRVPTGELIGSADDLLRSDPATGMLDVSYATAWQLGRLLAIQNLRVSAALRAWKASVRQHTVLTAQTELIGERVGESDRGMLLRERVAAALQAEPATDEPDSTAVPTQSLHERVADKVDRPDALAKLHADAELPDDVATWLAGLKRLENVPLAYLVPDARMLPSEAIRLFRVDSEWITALVEGAFSIGRATSVTAAHDVAVAGPVAEALPQPPASGFLLRSQVADDWSGLRVTASDPDGGALEVVRVDQLAPGLLLCLVDGLIRQVELHEPPATLHLEVRHQVPGRYVTVPAGVDKLVGQPIDGCTVTADVSGRRVVKIAKLAEDLGTAVHDAGAGAGAFTSAELALQLTFGAEGVAFSVTP